MFSYKLQGESGSQMPAFYTHLAFGMELYRGLKPGKLKTLLQEHPNAYRLGMSGPDLFFYYVPSLRLGMESPGERLHGERTGLFLRQLILCAEKLDGESREAAWAYVTGFLTHYLLDAGCHAYVYAQIDGECPRKGNGEHFMLEAAMDAYFSRLYLRRRPSQMRQLPMVRLGGKEFRTVAGLLAHAYSATFPEAPMSERYVRRVIVMVYTIMLAIHDPHGGKEKVLRGLEKGVLGYPFASPLFINDNTYNVGREEWQNFRRLFDKAREEAERVFQAWENYLTQACKAGKTADFERELVILLLGNRSYHTGEPL